LIETKKTEHEIHFFFASSIVLTSCKETEAQNSATPTNVVPFTEVGNQMKMKPYGKAARLA
jgi:hypothetical protein